MHEDVFGYFSTSIGKQYHICLNCNKEVDAISQENIAICPHCLKNIGTVQIVESSPKDEVTVQRVEDKWETIPEATQVENGKRKPCGGCGKKKIKPKFRIVKRRLRKKSQ